MKYLQTLFAALKNIALLAHRVSELETELKSLRTQIDAAKATGTETSQDLDRRLLRIEHFAEFANRFLLR